ncbi:hypothetical protein A2434_02200 [Candidatus Woesebacteria bacterium RIFOXYC1_FULL_41_14]|jgi:RNA recognition motif-containing protein|uniref:Glycine-rich RNA-binding protein 8 n=4 Tax=Candidatus Woeseibacteriota TaxID=1752722 RepID=A0A0G0Z479_9BACT|nr:MAG: Glycine-rich RNA-binding protein 8 [Candidatus Woesebacteria bacterium GW2011_GWB1_40_12]KKR89420.1 MAG: Glycine-rich RNA-binding protein 8 [Candidatus Woesebacteria bacterium GW2011_GWD1_41_12]KKS16871.1 MAG: Glycine-rich RNA-binding protein 8 [Candidatus Woesebacteria bacterium GW2011_GWA1_41_7]OGM81384.1 MAG: hypothetical protein A2393_01015 [Candidatus Woesebacteria bacterium RIFOXYB1_FULL_41_13]OGM84267.1 MAG: hypothetical protein A2434_02200 [Candidatus Woesebacteria bacterium RIF
MQSKLFIGNLAWEVSVEDLKALFAGAGTVSDAAIITDRMTGRSRGFGFVTMGSDAEAQAAIEKFNQYELKGRKINVNVAKPMEPRQ